MDGNSSDTRLTALAKFGFLPHQIFLHISPKNLRLKQSETEMRSLLTDFFTTYHYSAINEMTTKAHFS